MTRAIDRRHALKLGALTALTAGTTLRHRPAAAETACTNPVIRREVRQLSDAERTTFFNAVKALHDHGRERSVYARVVADYYNNPGEMHGVPAFLPWLRIYVHRFEQSLRKVNPTIVLPYWDWTKDSASPGRSAVMSSSYFGKGRPSDGIVTSGAFAGWQCNIPQRHGLRRRTDEIASLPSPRDIESLLDRSRTYDGLRVSLEQTFNTVLQAIGGKGGDLSSTSAPNDPLFWIIASFTDLLWSEWQQRYPSLAGTYNGKAGGKDVSTSDIMRPFDLSVRHALSSTSNGFCYRINRWAAE
ncbi:tyrosinase family protein [Streptomyces sp. NPDC054854]